MFTKDCACKIEIHLECDYMGTKAYALACEQN